MYPNMEEFKLAVRQYAINNEFDIKVEKSCKTIYRAFCKSGDKGCRCPWRINSRKMKGTATVEVTILVNKYQLQLINSFIFLLCIHVIFNFACNHFSRQTLMCV